MSNRNDQHGMGLLGWLGLIFVTLKLCGQIDWSWWWVTSPFSGWVVLVIGLTMLKVWLEGAKR